MKVKIKKILKVIICILVIYLLSFAAVFGYKFSKNQKLVNKRKEIFSADNVKIVTKNYDLTNQIASSVRTGLLKGNTSVLDMGVVYTEEAKANNSALKDNNSKMYYIKTEDSEYNDVFVTVEEDKVLYLMESVVLGDRIIYSMYPSSIDSYMIMPTDVPLISQIRYSLGLIPFIFKVDYLTVDDNGRKAFVVEEDKNFYGADDREYTRMRTYYDNDTMLAYKRTILKEDGTETLYQEYEVYINTLTDDDVAIPDLTGYRQILQNN